MLVETGFKTPLLLNYTRWEDGQTGGVGMFNANGAVSENYRIMADDPWGKKTVVWEARTDSASDADGGWDSVIVPIDPSFTYRLSTWVRRPVTGNGSFYLGTTTNNSIFNRNTGAIDGNPYFWTGTPSSDWELVVGHIHPANSGVGAIHPDSGRYTVKGKFAGITTDFTFVAGTGLLTHRSYLFYSTDTATRQQWVYPRIDKCDGSEPSISELLAGHDSRSLEIVKRREGALIQPMHVNNAMNVGGISEVGITRGLVAYYPLNKDARDYSSSGRHGTATGAALVGGGFDGRGAYRFSSGSTYISLPNDVGYRDELTVSAWFKGIGAPGNDYHIILGGQELELSVAPGGQIRTGVFTNARFVSNHGSGLLDGKWHHLAFNVRNGVKESFIDGVSAGTMTGITGTLSSVFANRRIGVYGSDGTYYSNGDICNVKIFNRALSPEEVAVEYKRTGPTKMTQYNGAVYIQGQIKETI